MPRKQVLNTSDSQQPIRPAITPEARENQMISLAVDLAEKQLRDGTASAQVITHFLKLATAKERLEQEILETQKKLLEAKTDNLKSSAQTEELYQKAIDAFRIYHGDNNHDESEPQNLL